MEEGTTKIEKKMRSNVQNDTKELNLRCARAQQSSHIQEKKTFTSSPQLSNPFGSTICSTVVCRARSRLRHSPPFPLSREILSQHLQFLLHSNELASWPPQRVVITLWLNLRTRTHLHTRNGGEKHECMLREKKN